MNRLYFLLIIFIPLLCFAQEDPFRNAVNDYVAQKTATEKLRSNLILAMEKRVISAPSEATKEIDQLLPISRKLKDRIMEVNLMRIKAASYFYQSKFSTTEQVGQQAYQLAERYNVQSEMPRILATIGNALVYQSKLIEGLETQNKGLKIAEKLKDKHGIHLIKNNLVAIHLQFYDYDIAKSYLEDNINYYQNVPGAANVLATSYNNLGLVYEKQKDYKSSIRYLHKALGQTGAHNNKVLLAQIHNNLGNGYSRSGEVDSAHYFFQKAYAINLESKNLRSQAASVIGLSDYQFNKKNYKESKDLAMKAYTMGSQLKSIDVLRESADQLFKNYSYLGKIDSAMYYHKIANKLSDSLINKDNTRITTKMTMQHEFDKKEDQYKHQQTIHELNLQHQILQNQLNKDELEKSLQDRHIQTIALENEKLQNTENTQKLKLTTQGKILAENKNKTLQQENELSALRIKQLWLYGIIGLIVLGSIFYFLWNRSRVQQLKTANKLKEKEAAELMHQNKVTESELKAIRSQMNPHFIFNVLNSIESYIVESDANNAQILVQKFAKLSRMILENSTQSLSSLESEWKINQLYTEIEHIRFDQHFTYHFDNRLKEHLNQYLIPPMMLQPLVENAILHGLRYELEEGAHLSVILEEQGNQIAIRVEDNGSGLNHDKSKKLSYKKTSFGLSSVKDRIEILNQNASHEKASFELLDRRFEGKKGCVAVLLLPKVKADIQEDGF